MPLRLDSQSADFADRFRSLLALKRETAQDVEQAVRDIIADVVARGDRALFELTAKFDRVDLAKTGLRVAAAEIDAAEKSCDAEMRSPRSNSRATGLRPITGGRSRSDDRFTDALGVELGARWTAIEAVGLYVPGGTAAYPSSVLMNAVPAKVAGVPRLVMVVPAPDGKLNPLVLAAAQPRRRRRDLSHRRRAGGGGAGLRHRRRIAPVAKIVGPGNAYVAAAKRLVFGKVGIDMIAGPSEVLILADKTANADWIAADLLAQAEHDASAQSILITDDAGLADRRREARSQSQLKTLPRAKVAGASWSDFGAIIVVRKLDDAIALVDQLAPEHLEILADDPEALVGTNPQCGRDLHRRRIRRRRSATTSAGSNHVLPTARSARFSSGLGVLDFMKRTSLLKCGPEQLRALGPAAIALGEAEGLSAHARSVSIRLNQK